MVCLRLIAKSDQFHSFAPSSNPLDLRGKLGFSRLPDGAGLLPALTRSPRAVLIPGLPLKNSGDSRGNRFGHALIVGP